VFSSLWFLFFPIIEISLTFGGYIMVKVMISTGEASGDMHGASIAEALKLLQPDISILGMGGSAMRAAGVDIVYDIADLGVFGLAEVVKKLPRMHRLRGFLAGVMERERPDVLVLIDYGGFNIPLAQIAKARGIRAVYYIPPKVWVWGRGRAKKIAAAVDLVAAIFPFEVDIYRAAGARTVFVGNPLIDIVQPTLSKEAAYARFGAEPARPVVLLMPGSRDQEIANLLPTMLAAGEQIVEKLPNCQFFLPIASTISREILQNIIDRSSIRVELTTENTYDLMQIADAAIAASGTATLEAALMGVPTVIIYKVAALTYFFGIRLINITHFGLPNIVAGRGILPELLQGEVTAENIAREALTMLTDDAVRGRICDDLAEVRRSLGQAGAVNRAAQEILAVATNGSGGV
jgi:lipid-A-disaccharide synthase